jgi:hypothetical protein
MPEYNIPNPRNYRVDGGVQAFFEKELSANVYAPPHCLGNIIEASYTPEMETFEHKSSLFGMAQKDRVITIETSASLSMVLNELVGENVELAFQTNQRDTGITVYPPRVARPTFALGEAVLNGGAAIHDVLWVKPLQGDTVYVEGVTGDYTVNTADGKIELTMTTSIGAGDEVVVAFRTAETATRASIFSDTDISGRLHIVSYHASGGGPSTYIYYPRVDVKTEGDISVFNMSEPKQFTLNMEIVSVGDLYGYIYMW